MQAQIIRRETFTVNKAVQNQYGDLVVTTNNGVGYKIGKKRANLFPVFQEGAEVNVGFATYMEKEYIAEAEGTGTHKPIMAAAEKIGTEIFPDKPSCRPDTNRSIERQVSAKLAMEFCEGTVAERMDAAETIFQWIHKS